MVSVVESLPDVLTSDVVDGARGAVGLLVQTGLGWHVWSPPHAELRIDTYVEPVLSGNRSGCLLGLHLVNDRAAFAKPTPARNGWWYRHHDPRDRDRWLAQEVPVLLVLHDDSRQTAYWQHVTADSAIADEHGFTIAVPADQRFDAGSAGVLAGLARQPAPDALAGALAGLPDSCAARLRLLDRTEPAHARTLASELSVAGPHPRVRVQKLIAEATSEWSWQCWVALGEYANEHALPGLAAECFLRVPIGHGPQGAARWHAFAGLLLCDEDPQRARQLLSEASSQPAAAGLAAVGLARLDSGTTPGAVPSGLGVGPGQGRDEPTVLRFLADQRGRAGDRDEAIDLHSQALRLVPGAASQQLALAQAILDRPASQGDARRAGYRRAGNLAVAARAARRAYGGNSVTAAELLGRARRLAGDEEAVVRTATVAPHGDATEEEARSVALAFSAACVSYERGELDSADGFAAVVRAGGGASLVSQVDAARAVALGADPRERRQRWRDVVASTPDGPARHSALEQLAALGEWPLPELDAARQADLLEAGAYEAVQARAYTAQGDTDGALALLRANAATSAIAAEEYARQLAALDRVDECLAVCDGATDRFPGTRLLLYPLEVLVRAGRRDEVIDRAEVLLRRTDLSFAVRNRVRDALAEALLARQDWARGAWAVARGIAETRRVRRAVRAGRVDPSTYSAGHGDELSEIERLQAWILIICQLNGGWAEQAWRSLRLLKPEPRTPLDVSVWFEVHQRHGWSPDAVATAVKLAGLPGLVASQSTSMLQALLPQATWSGQELSTEIQRTLLAHRVESEALRSGVAALMEPSELQQAHVVDAIWAGTQPLGAVSTVTGVPYLLTLLHQSAGLVPAATDSSDIYASEIDAVMAALGNVISVETSAMFLAAGVCQRWADVAGQFSGVLLAQPAAHDIEVSHVAARATIGVTSERAVDPRTGQLQLGAAVDAANAAFLARGAAVHAAARTCELVPVIDLSAVGGYLMDLVGVWMAPLAVAAARGTALYSDDVVLRDIARGFGVPAFGTVALFEVLYAKQILPDDSGALLQRLFQAHVVDLGPAPQIALHESAHVGPATTALLLNLSRRAFWAGRSDDDLLAATVAFTQAVADDPAALAAVVEALASGQAQAFDPRVALALLGVVVLFYVTGVTPEAAGAVLPPLRAAALQFDVDPDPLLRDQLVVLLTDDQQASPMTVPAARELVDTLLSQTT